MKVWESRIRLQDNQSSSISKFKMVGKAVGSDYLYITCLGVLNATTEMAVVFQSQVSIWSPAHLILLAGGQQDRNLSQSQPWWSDHRGAAGPHQLPGAAQDFCFHSTPELPLAFGVLSTWRSSRQSFLMTVSGVLAVLAADSLQKLIYFCVASPSLPEFSVKQDSSPVCWKAEILHYGVFNFSNDCCHSISQ